MKRPTTRSLARPLAYAIATWFGCGFVPRAPGTAGTLGAIPLYLAVRPHGPGAVLAAAAVVAALGLPTAGYIVRDRADPDPQIVVVDEVVGVLVALAAAPPTFGGLVWGFLLFRIFDQTKPAPARAAERLPAGWGVIADDVVAGIYAAAVLAILRGAGAL